jgi:hypothetical protein
MPTPEELAAQAAAVESEKDKGTGADSTAGADKGSAGADGTQDVTPTPDPVEVTARAQGWKPKEEYGGEPGTFVDAKEFLGRKPLYDRVKTLLRDNREVKKTVEAMAKHWTKSVQREVDNKIVELGYQKREAVKAGDVVQVEAIDKAIDLEKTRKAEAEIPVRPEVAPEVVAWVEANPWYMKDPELHDFAVSYNDAYMKRHPGDIAGGLERTAMAVRKAYPDKFPAPVVKPKVDVADDGADKDKPPVSSVESGGVKPGGGSKKFTMNRLSVDQRRVYDQIVTEHKVTTHDKFFQSLEEIGELR